ncbi:MAG: EscU/YscU/HrcU family type III secretion system export apparatus switch protein [Hyphomicrobiales bacterium]
MDTSDDGSIKRAVALHYDHKDAPKVVAKGEGHIAEQIIAAAAAHGVYIKENPLLAQALGAVELDEEIPVELYTAVAEIIGFVLSLKEPPSTPLASQAD